MTEREIGIAVIGFMIGCIVTAITLICEILENDK